MNNHEDNKIHLSTTKINTEQSEHLESSKLSHGTNIPALAASSPFVSPLETDIVSLSPINIIPEALKGGNSERVDIVSGSTSIHCPVSCFCLHKSMNCVHAFLLIDSKSMNVLAQQI